MVDGTAIGLLLALTYSTAVVPPSATTPILVTLTSGARTYRDTSGNSSAIIQSGATLNNVQSGQQTDEIQSGNNSTTLTSGGKEVSL